jgi:organic hydroperoxide reductase OsmC/OhrA
VPVRQRSKVFTYQADVVWDGDRRCTAHAGERPTLYMAPPADFPGGLDDQWSPEHLFLAALQSCTMLSFLSQCSHRGIGVAAYRSSAQGEVGRREDDGRYAFERVEITVMARVEPGVAGRARALTERAERDCFISASTTAEIETDWRIIE